MDCKHGGASGFASPRCNMANGGYGMAHESSNASNGEPPSPPAAAQWKLVSTECRIDSCMGAYAAHARYTWHTHHVRKACVKKPLLRNLAIAPLAAPLAHASKVAYEKRSA